MLWFFFFYHHSCFSVGGLHGRSSATLTGQQSCSQLKSLHIAGLHTWLTRWAMCPLCCAVQHWAAQSPSWFYFAGQINSRTMLLPLLQRFTSQMRVCLYHTPDLRGLLRLLVPQRFNETIGVQHIKVYLFDDSIIISGYERFQLFTHEFMLRSSLTRFCFHLCLIVFWLSLCLQKAFPIKVQVFATIVRKWSKSILLSVH